MRRHWKNNSKSISSNNSNITNSNCSNMCLKKLRSLRRCTKRRYRVRTKRLAPTKCLHRIPLSNWKKASMSRNKSSRSELRTWGSWERRWISSWGFCRISNQSLQLSPRIVDWSSRQLHPSNLQSITSATRTSYLWFCQKAKSPRPYSNRTTILRYSAKSRIWMTRRQTIRSSLVQAITSNLPLKSTTAAQPWRVPRIYRQIICWTHFKNWDRSYPLQTNRSTRRLRTKLRKHS